MAIKNGNGSDNLIKGTAGDDFIYGKGGNDMLYGKAGNDFLSGGKGSDSLYGGAGDDTLSGGGGNDLLDGGGHNDYLKGGGGNDTLLGAKGDDLMVGGAGADSFNGGDDWDTVDYSGSTTAVLSYIRYNSSGLGATGDTYVNVENVIGSDYDDLLQGMGAGTALGGLGDDTLYGGGTSGSSEEGGRIRGDDGTDRLNMTYGQTDAWIQRNQGSDIIDGFLEDEDLLFIDLSDFGLGDTFDSTEIRNSDSITATGSNAQFIYEDDAKRLWFDSNGTGAGGLLLVAEFENSTINNNNLGTNDFVYQL